MRPKPPNRSTPSCQCPGAANRNAKALVCGCTGVANARTDPGPSLQEPAHHAGHHCCAVHAPTGLGAGHTFCVEEACRGLWAASSCKCIAVGPSRSCDRLASRQTGACVERPCARGPSLAIGSAGGLWTLECRVAAGCEIPVFLSAGLSLRRGTPRSAGQLPSARRTRPIDGATHKPQQPPAPARNAAADKPHTHTHTVTHTRARARTGEELPRSHLLCMSFLCRARQSRHMLS